jgi:hypothetical protein
MNIVDLLPQSSEMVLESPKMRVHVIEMLVFMLNEMSAATRAFFMQKDFGQFSAAEASQVLSLCQELAEPYALDEVEALLSGLNRSVAQLQVLAQANDSFQRESLAEFTHQFDIPLDFPPVFLALMQLHFLSRYTPASHKALDIQRIKQTLRLSSWTAKRLVSKFQTSLTAFSNHFLASFVTSSSDSSTLVEV